MTRVFIWKNNSPQEWEEISFSAFSKARRNGCFTGRFFVETVKMFRDEIQDILGISRPTAYNLVKQGVFHSVRVGGHIRISKKSFDDWLDHADE